MVIFGTIRGWSFSRQDRRAGKERKKVRGLILRGSKNSKKQKASKRFKKIQKASICSMKSLSLDFGQTSARDHWSQMVDLLLA